MSPSPTVLRRSLIAGVLTLSACRDTAGPRDTTPVPESSPAPAVASQEPEGEQAALARVVPGFGGLFLDESGAPTVYLTDPGQRLSAQRALTGIARDHGFDPSALRVRKGEFTWQQLEAWFEPASRSAMAERGVVYADLDEASNRVTIGVENADAGGRARSLLRRLGVPDRAVLIRETRPVELAATLQDRVRPVGGGLQINFGNFALYPGLQRDPRRSRLLHHQLPLHRRAGGHRTGRSITSRTGSTPIPRSAPRSRIPRISPGGPARRTGAAATATAPADATWRGSLTPWAESSAPRRATASTGRSPSAPPTRRSRSTASGRTLWWARRSTRSAGPPDGPSAR